MSDDIQNEFYADREDAGDRTIEHARDRLEVVKSIFETNEFSRILDTRCGDGSFTMTLAEACGATDIHGFELYENKRRRANRRNMEAKRVDLNNAEFPFEDDFFDAICAMDIIEHLYDPDHFLDEVRRILKPNGTLVLATPNLASLHNRIALLLGFQPFAENLSRRYPIGHIFENHSLIGDETPPSSHHFRVFTLRSLRELLQHHNFSIDNLTGASAVLPQDLPLYSAAAMFERVLSSIPSLSYEIVITAQPMEAQ